MSKSEIYAAKYTLVLRENIFQIEDCPLGVVPFALVPNRRPTPPETLESCAGAVSRCISVGSMGASEPGKQEDPGDLARPTGVDA